MAEVMAGQLQAAVSSIVERNMMIDALSLKQSELTARLAMQVEQTGGIRAGESGKGGRQDAECPSFGRVRHGATWARRGDV